MEILIVCILLILSSICSATETAFSSANRIRLKSMSENASSPRTRKRAASALRITEDFDKSLTAILIVNNVVNLSSSSITTVYCTARFGASGATYATIIITVLVLIFGEILPKCLAKENAESFSMFMSAALTAAVFILNPLIWIFTQIRKAATALVGKKAERPYVTEEELKHIINEIETEGVLEEQESDLVRSALDFDETKIEQVLVPRVNIVGVELGADIEKIRSVFSQNGFSRMPVYDKTIDDIIGIIHQTDFFNLYLDGGVSIEGIMTAPVYISENKSLSEVLRLMQKKKVHMAVVVDQYGGTAGICTLEDIIEELVGEIYDEHDEEDDSFATLSQNRWLVSGETSVSDFLDKAQLERRLIRADSNSMGGWITELIDRFPDDGEVIDAKPFSVTVKMENPRRIDSLTIEYIEPEKGKEE
ncbi:MAG: hemolysin family protein [Ruminococcus sp.]|nr:hemolysin family protein [Ruminococcus sp.]